ncbi:SGNH/GDSL hydrolase family protein [Rugamonas sp. DEMB1]|uniref:SGNH/GDSL hydrolase family protein n=1 Tax=Rugamonas sp. DEMB1 TaxID=3039386 RepID=UPI00244B0386|nr:SGNH/GDSL hydrolase family protein [Rugamonas sp. DEMB1]WGG48928.1 SGNH/GDSL hydrolase family protein [Rugamonas sp. DEMB1]
MAKQIPVSATVETTTLAVSVTAAPDSAGVAVPLAVASSGVTLTNTSIACALQYKVNSGTWVKLGRDDGTELIVNLQVDSLYLRRATLDGGLATANLSIASKPGSADVLVGAAVLGAVVKDAAYIASNNATVNIAAPITQSFPKLRAALAAMRAGQGNVRAALLGDSTTAGVWALGIDNGTNCRAVSAPAVLAALLNSSGTPANSDSFWGDQNFQPSGLAPQAYDPRIKAFGSGWSVYSGTTLFSLGGRAFTNSGTVSAFGFLPNGMCDTFDVYYYTNPALGTFKCTRTGDADGPNVSTVSAASGIAKTTFIGALGNANPININYVGSGSVYIAGIVGYNSNEKCVQVFNMGWGSSTSVDWAKSANGWDPINALKFVAPHFTELCLGTNDEYLATTPAVYAASMASIIDAAAISGDVMVTTNFPIKNATVSLATQRSYVVALKAVVDARPGVVWNDMHQRLRTWEDQNPFGYYATGSVTNELHPLAALHRERAKATAQIIASL